MKRRFLKLGMFLLLGAILNVVVAWSEVFWPYDSLPLNTNVHVLSPSEIDQSRLSNKHLDGQYGIRQEWPLLTWDSIAAGEQGPLSYYVYQQGWPARSLRGWCYKVNGSPKTEYALFKQLGSKRFAVLPLQPLWPGFAINTIFYAAVLWLPVAGLSALRRRRRSKRGLCPACAYPVGNSAVCTECGVSVHQ